MHGNRIRIQRIVSAGCGVYCNAYEASGNDVAGHGRTSGRASLAFNLNGLRNISRLADRDRKIVAATILYELRRSHTVFTGGESDVSAGRIAHHAEFFVHASGDRRARGQANEWEDRQVMNLHNENLTAAAGKPTKNSRRDCFGLIRLRLSTS